MESERPAVLFVGCGRMGGALAKALVADRRVLAFDPQAELPGGVERVEDLAGAGLPARLVIVLAVKPQMFGGLSVPLRALAQQGRVCVSIMAGITLRRLDSALGAEASIIRAMPNTPAAIGHGITAAVASNGISEADREEVSRVLEAAGQLVWLDKESDLDAVTAVSGSGPAFFYRFAEAMIEAGIAEGLSEPVATQLVRQSFIGAARLCEMETATLAVLREQVTSPGGTTAAGLGAMNTDLSVNGLARRVVSAAAARSRELAVNS